MSAPSVSPASQFSAGQAVELCLLVELEARWENLRKGRARTPQTRALTIEELNEAQKAFAAFRARLAAYNRQHAPAHVTDLLLNYPNRLAPWCLRMRDLYLQVVQDSRVACPVHLLEKAYRWADGIAGRMGKEPFPRSPAVETTEAAVRELDALARWCDDKNRIAA